MRRLSTWLTVILGLCCALLAYWNLQERWELTAAQAEIADRIAAEKHDRQETKQEPAAQPHTADGTVGAMVAGGGVARATVAVGGNGRVLKMSDLIKNHPEMAAIYDREIRRNILRKYSAALADLSLAPDKLAKLKSLLVDQQLSQSDARDAAASLGLVSGSPELAKATRLAQQEVNQEIIGLIGNDGYAKLQQSLNVSSYSTQVKNTYALDFEDAGMPISADQSQNLAQLMYNNSNPTANPDASTPGYRQFDPTTWLSPSDQDLLMRAAQVLSAAQVEILKTDLKSQNQQNTIMQSYFRRGVTNIIWN